MLIHPDLSRSRMRGVNQALRYIVEDAARNADFFVGHNGGLRTPETQAALIASGASWTTRSKHLVGLAVDLVAWVDGAPAWGPRSVYERISAEMMRAATEARVFLIWGGSWKVQDLGHFEIVRLFPASPPTMMPVARPKRVELI